MYYCFVVQLRFMMVAMMITIMINIHEWLSQQVSLTLSEFQSALSDPTSQTFNGGISNSGLGAFGRLP